MAVISSIYMWNPRSLRSNLNFFSQILQYLQVWITSKHAIYIYIRICDFVSSSLMNDKQYEIHICYITFSLSLLPECNCSCNIYVGFRTALIDLNVSRGNSLYHCTYIRLKLRICCALIKGNRSFPRKKDLWHLSI